MGVRGVQHTLKLRPRHHGLGARLWEAASLAHGGGMGARPQRPCPRMSSEGLSHPLPAALEPPWWGHKFSPAAPTPHSSSLQGLFGQKPRLC